MYMFLYRARSIFQINRDRPTPSNHKISNFLHP